MARSPTFPAQSARTGAWRDSSAPCGTTTAKKPPAKSTERPCHLFKSIVTVACRANPAELVADLRDRFQVMGFRGAVSLVRRVCQFLDVRVPVRIAHPLRNHQRVRGFCQRCRAAHHLLPVVVRFGREIMLALFV